MNKRGFDCALSRAIEPGVFVDSLLPLAPFFSLFVLYITQTPYAFFSFFSCTLSGLEPLTTSIHLASDQSVFYTTTLRGSVENSPSKNNLYYTCVIAFPKICTTISLFKCLAHVARCMKICIAFVGPWWMKGRGNDLFPSTSAVLLVTYPSMSSMNFFKLCKILVDHDQCIQWCKEHNLLTSSIKCPREKF